MTAPSTCAVNISAFPLDFCGIQRKTGVRGDVYFADKRDITGVTFGTNGQVLTITMATGKQFFKLSGEHNTHKINPGKSKYSGTKNVMYDADVELNFHPNYDSVYSATPVVLATDKILNELNKLKYGVFAYITNEGILKFIGIDQNPQFPTDFFDLRGLGAVDGNGQEEGVKLGEHHPYIFKFKGEFYNRGLNFLPTAGTTIELVKSTFESTYCVPAA